MPSLRGSIFRSTFVISLPTAALTLAYILANGTPLLADSTVPPDLAHMTVAIPAKSILRYKADASQTERIKHTANITLAISGQTMRLNVVEVDKLTFIKVDAATGNVTLESRNESSKATLEDGSAMPGDSPKGVETIVMSPQNLLVSYANSSPDDDNGESNRLNQASTVMFSDKPVSVGDKWSYDYKADANLKTRPAHADFEIVGAVAAAGGTAFKIKMTYAESGDKPITGSGTHVIEMASGDDISYDCEFKGVDMGGQTASVKVSMQRLEGGPLSSSKNGP